MNTFDHIDILYINRDVFYIILQKNGVLDNAISDIPAKLQSDYLNSK